MVNKKSRKTKNKNKSRQSKKIKNNKNKSRQVKTKKSRRTRRTRRTRKSKKMMVCRNTLIGGNTLIEDDLNKTICQMEYSTNPKFYNLCIARHLSHQKILGADRDRELTRNLSYLNWKDAIEKILNQQINNNTYNEILIAIWEISYLNKLRRIKNKDQKYAKLEYDFSRLKSQWENTQNNRNEDINSLALVPIVANKVETLRTMYNRIIAPSPSDGNCQFHSLANQLNQLYRTNIHNHDSVRSDVVNYILTHESEFIQFISDTENYTTFEELIDYMSTDRTWGDNASLYAAARYYNVCIHIVSDRLINKINCPNDNIIVLAYDDGIHYNGTTLINL